MDKAASARVALAVALAAAAVALSAAAFLCPSAVVALPAAAVALLAAAVLSASTADSSALASVTNCGRLDRKNVSRSVLNVGLVRSSPVSGVMVIEVLSWSYVVQAVDFQVHLYDGVIGHCDVQVSVHTITHQRLKFCQRAADVDARDAAHFGQLAVQAGHV